MSYRGIGDDTMVANQTEVTQRLVDWLGEERRPAIESMIDEYAARNQDGGASSEDEVAWAVHIAKGHIDVDLEMALLAAEVLERLGFDPVRVRFMRSMACRECEAAL